MKEDCLKKRDKDYTTITAQGTYSNIPDSMSCLSFAFGGARSINARNRGLASSKAWKRAYSIESSCRVKSSLSVGSRRASKCSMRGAVCALAGGHSQTKVGVPPNKYQQRGLPPKCCFCRQNLQQRARNRSHSSKKYPCCEAIKNRFAKLIMLVCAMLGYKRHLGLFALSNVM